MENLLNLNYEGQEIRSFYSDKTKEIIFNLKDCCRILGISNSRDAKKDLTRRG